MKKIPIIMMLIAPYFLFGMYMAENLELLSIGLLVFGIIMNIVLHFIFCADLFSSIYCYIRSKKNTVQ